MRKDMFIMPLLLCLFLFNFGCINQGEENKVGGTGNNTSIRYTISAFHINEIKNISIILLQRTQENKTNQMSYTPSYTYDPTKELVIYFFPPANPNNQGGAILLKKGDADVLIDAGINGTILIRYLQALNVDDIELFIITCADPNHYRGAKTLIKYIPIEHILLPQNPEMDQGFISLLNFIRSKNIDSLHLSYNDEYEINGVVFTVLNPQPTERRFYDNHNDAYAFRIKDRAFSIILPSSIEEGAMAAIIDNFGDSLRSDVFELPNFGLKGTAALDLFITKCAPKDAVILGSYKDDFNKRYTVMEKLRVRGIPIHSTFDNIAKKLKVLKLITDGSTYQFYEEEAKK